MADFYIGKGDLPLWTETLTDGSGNPVLIQGATLVMSMVPVRGGADVITAGGVVTNLDDGTTPNKGKVSRQMLTGETNTPGDYLVRVVATLSAKPITFPNTGYFLWTITPTAVQQQHRYLSNEELKASLQLTGLTAADRDLEVAIEAASRGLETAYDMYWTPTTTSQTRYYTGYNHEVKLGDVLTASQVALDYGIGTYDVVLNNATDYRLLPIQNGPASGGGNGEPYHTLRLTRTGSQAFYIGLPGERDAVKITGTFGWEQTPSSVKAAVTIIATRLLRRTRDAPFGIIAFGANDIALRAGAIARDPEVSYAMEGIGSPWDLTP